MNSYIYLSTYLLLSTNIEGKTTHTYPYYCSLSIAYLQANDQERVLFICLPTTASTFCSMHEISLKEQGFHFSILSHIFSSIPHMNSLTWNFRQKHTLFPNPTVR